MSFFQSLTYPLKGIRYLFKHKGLFKYILIPLTVDLLITIVVIVFLIFQTTDLMEWLNSLIKLSEGTFAGILKGVLSVLEVFGNIVVAILIILFVMPILLTLISAIIDPFFRGFLYSKIRVMEGMPEKQYPFKIAIKLILKGIALEIIKIVLYLLISIPLLLLNLIPVLGTIVYVILQFLLTAVFLGWEYQAPYLEEGNLSFTKQLRFVNDNKKMIIGFGVTAGLLLLIPIIQAFFFATHTISGSLMSIGYERGK